MSLFTEILHSKIINVYSFDANPDIIASLNETIHIISNDKSQPPSGRKEIGEYPRKLLPDHWKMEVAAFVENYIPGDTVSFELGIGEHGHLSSIPDERPGKNSSAVPALNIDTFVRREKIDHIDILKIDAEGNDPFVINGGKNFLSNQGATLLIFELNSIWPQNSKNLFEKLYKCLKHGPMYVILKDKKA